MTADGGRQRRRAFGVDELGGGEEDEEEAGRDHGGHPHLLAALAPLGAAPVGRRGVACERDGSAALVLQQHHQASQRQHGDEEEEVVANDGADEAHLGGAGGQHAVLAQFVQPADDQLEGHKVEDDRGDAEEALQVDLDAAANEQHTEDDRDCDAEQRSGKAEQFGGVEGDGREDEHRLHAFAENEQKDEEEEADL